MHRNWVSKFREHIIISHISGKMQMREESVELAERRWLEHGPIVQLLWTWCSFIGIKAFPEFLEGVDTFWPESWQYVL